MKMNYQVKKKKSLTVLRNTLKYVAEKDKKAFANDLKSIYHAPNEESGYERMQAVTKKNGTTDIRMQ